jgi:hypothetical protein
VTHDPHGYRRLHDDLRAIEARLDQLGRSELAGHIRDALRFYGTGSPSEYLGESRLALQRVLAAGPDLPHELRAAVADQMSLIEQGQQRIGGA